MRPLQICELLAKVNIRAGFRESKSATGSLNVPKQDVACCSQLWKSPPHPRQSSWTPPVPSTILRIRVRSKTPPHPGLRVLVFQWWPAGNYSVRHVRYPKESRQETRTLGQFHLFLPLRESPEVCENRTLGKANRSPQLSAAVEPKTRSRRARMEPLKAANEGDIVNLDRWDS